MNTLYFFSLDAVKAFAEENTLRNEFTLRPMDNYEHHKRLVLEVADFSEVLPCYEVEPSVDEQGIYYLSARYFVLRIIPTGELFRMTEYKPNKWRLHLFEYAPALRDNGFTFEMEMPNYIGKATEKKLTAWIDWLHLERTARVNWSNSVKARNSAFAERVRKAHPNARFYTSKQDGWCGEIHLDWDRFHVHYESLDDGSFHKRVDLRYQCIPTDDEILG